MRGVVKMTRAGVALQLAVATALTFAAPLPAVAFEVFGVRLFGDPPPPPPGSIVYEVHITAGDEPAIERAVRRASQLVSTVRDPSPSAAALIATAREDYQRILGALYGEGRYGPTISILIDGREAAILPIDTEIGDSALVEITVDPGPVFLFDGIAIENRPPPVPDDRTVPDSPEQLGLVPGELARSTVVIASEGALVRTWRELGYPKAAIAERTVEATYPTATLDVGIAVEPGRRAVFGETTVSGTERMNPEFVAYYADLPEGELFDPDDLERASDQLRRLEVFQAQRLVEADTITPEGTLPINIVVAERKRRVIGAGAQFSTLDGAGATGFWRHRNLFGQAEKLAFEATVGGINEFDPGNFDYSVRSEFIKPGFGTPYTDLVATLYAEQVFPDTYRARTVGGRVGLNHRIYDRFELSAFGVAEATRVDRAAIGNGDFFILSLPVTASYDGSNDRLDPTRGFRLRGVAEPFYETNFENTGLISEVEGSAYVSFGADDRITLAGRAMVGSIVGAPLAEVPANRLYFAGGGGSIRGYPYRGVGPLDPFGNVTGGRSIFTASAEARIRVTNTIGVVPFVDAGNAFTTEYPDFSEPLRVGVGIGARYYTGLGPLRLDVAVPIDPLEGDPNFAFYVGIGQAF